MANYRRIERDDKENDVENEHGFAGVSRYAPFVGVEDLVHEDGTDCYQARVRDSAGREHHFAFHFPTRWGAAAAHDLLARRLEYYGPRCAAGTTRNFASDVSWDRLVGVLIAGAAWTGPSGSGEGPVEGATKKGEKSGAKRAAAGRKRKADAAEDAPEEEEEEGEEEEEEEEASSSSEEEPSPYNGKRQMPAKFARKVAPLPPRNPRQPAHSPCMRLVGLAVEKESIWEGDDGPTRGVVTGFHESVPHWGETFDVLLDENHLDAGLTFEELLLILANDSDKERSVSDETWALAMGLLRLDDPGSSLVVRQFHQLYPRCSGFDRVDGKEGKYEAKILDKKGRLHHFAYHFPTKWGAAAAHEILARRLEFHGPGVIRGTLRNFKPDAPWDALVGVLIAGAKWRPRVRSNATGDDHAESDAADKKRSETLMSFIKWDHKSGRLRLAA